MSISSVLRESSLPCMQMGTFSLLSVFGIASLMSLLSGLIPSMLHFHD